MKRLDEIDGYSSFIANTVTNFKDDDTDEIQYEHILMLDHLLLNDLKSELEQEAIVSRLPCDVLRKIQSLYVSFETKIEMNIDSIISENPKITNFIFNGNKNILMPYFKRYRDLVNREILHLKLKKNDKILWIGGGPFPVSPIMISKAIGCQFDCIDVSKSAVYKSQDILKKLGSCNVLVEHHDGKNINVSSYDVIMIAVLASPIQEIIDNIQLNAKESAKVLKRVTYGFRKLIYPTEVFKNSDNKIKWDSTDRARRDQVISHIIGTINN
ncbi:nicotianamine synthase family protein [Sodalis sp. RH15]|uniref:nicotianamine synthase family protein n=1 Tax=Sodalis sp. RH15 TaxID=3394330 RepID=UPI0039B5906E